MYPSLLNYRGYKKDVRVRVEPCDGSIVYVCLEGIWHVCRSTAAGIHDAMPQPMVLERSAAKLQLRSEIAALAREAQQSAYEQKMSQASPVIDRRNAAPQMRQVSGPRPSKPRKRPTTRTADIEDLAMEGESA